MDTIAKHGYFCCFINNTDNSPFIMCSYDTINFKITKTLFKASKEWSLRDIGAVWYDTSTCNFTFSVVTLSPFATQISKEKPFA